MEVAGGQGGGGASDRISHELGGPGSDAGCDIAGVPNFTVVCIDAAVEVVADIVPEQKLVARAGVLEHPEDCADGGNTSELEVVSGIHGAGIKAHHGQAIHGGSDVFREAGGGGGLTECVVVLARGVRPSGELGAVGGAGDLGRVQPQDEAAGDR